MVLETSFFSRFHFRFVLISFCFCRIEMKIYRLLIGFSTCLAKLQKNIQNSDTFSWSFFWRAFHNINQKFSLVEKNISPIILKMPVKNLLTCRFHVIGKSILNFMENPIYLSKYFSIHFPGNLSFLLNIHKKITQQNYVKNVETRKGHGFELESNKPFCHFSLKHISRWQ
jgi:hypothetical protein